MSAPTAVLAGPDALDPKQELLRLPSKFETILDAAQVYFDKLVGQGSVNEQNYPEIVEHTAISTVMNHCGIVDGMEEEIVLFDKVNLGLMAYAGRKYPNT